MHCDLEKSIPLIVERKRRTWNCVFRANKWRIGVQLQLQDGQKYAKESQSTRKSHRMHRDQKDCWSISLSFLWLFSISNFGQELKKNGSYWTHIKETKKTKDVCEWMGSLYTKTCLRTTSVCWIVIPFRECSSPFGQSSIVPELCNLKSLSGT